MSKITVWQLFLWGFLYICSPFSSCQAQYERDYSPTAILVRVPVYLHIILKLSGSTWARLQSHSYSCGGSCISSHYSQAQHKQDYSYTCGGSYILSQFSHPYQAVRLNMNEITVCEQHLFPVYYFNSLTLLKLAGSTWMRLQSVSYTCGSSCILSHYSQAISINISEITVCELHLWGFSDPSQAVGLNMSEIVAPHQCTSRGSCIFSYCSQAVRLNMNETTVHQLHLWGSCIFSPYYQAVSININKTIETCGGSCIFFQYFSSCQH